MRHNYYTPQNKTICLKQAETEDVVLVLNTIDGADGTVLYSAKLLFVGDCSMIHYAVCALVFLCILRLLELLISVLPHSAGAHQRWLVPTQVNS